MRKILTTSAFFLAVTLLGLLLSSGSALAADNLGRPDTAGEVGRWSSLALDDNGYPVVAYHQKGSTDATGTLKVLHCGNALCTSGNSFETIDDGNVYDSAKSMKLDSSGNPVIAYMDGAFELVLVRCQDPDCDDTESTTVDVPSGDIVYVGYHLSMDLDDNDVATISYLDLRYPNFRYFLNVARCNDTDCDSPTLVELDPPGAATVPSGSFTGFGNNIVLDDDGYPAIGFNDSVGVHLLRCGNEDCTNDNYTSNTIGTGHGWTTSNFSTLTAVVLDSSGYPVVAFQNADRILTVVHCNDSDCAGDNESSATPDTEYVPSGEPDLGLLGLYVSIALDSSGYPVVSYHTHTFGDLKVLHCGNANCSSGNSIVAVERVDHAGAYTSIQLNSSGFPVISHNYEHSQDLGVVVCNSANCDGLGADTDHDGCPDAIDEEDSNFWDFFDTPDNLGFRNRVVDSVDVDRVIDRFGKTDNGGAAAINRNSDPLTDPNPTPSYHPAFDRSYDNGLAAPDGGISLSDILWVASQQGNPEEEIEAYDCR